MKAMSERVVKVEGIARLWWPMVPVPFKRSYKVGKGPWEVELKSFDEVEHHLFTDLGDYSAVEDYRVVYVVRREYVKPGVVGVICHTRVKVARGWARPESEDEYLGLFPSEEE